MSVVFFTDRDLGTQFPAILKTAGLRVEKHADHFPEDCPDDVWLQTIAGKGWVVLTHDRHIRYKPNELTAVINHNVALLVLDPILAFLANHPSPVIGKVYRASAVDILRKADAPGRVEIWYPKK